MAAFVLSLLLLLAIAGHSSATYCICRDGVSDSALQKSIDYACGAGADCSPIIQNGPCYNPNTVRDHCNYAVNSYYQRKGQAPGSCDFSGSATVSQSAPSSQSSSCVYPSSPSNAGTSTSPTTGSTPPSSTPPTGTGTGTGIPPPSGTGTGIPPPSGTGTGTISPGTTTGGTPSSLTPGSTGTPVFGLGPTGSGITNTDNGASRRSHLYQNLFYSFALTLLLSGYVNWRA